MLRSFWLEVTWWCFRWLEIYSSLWNCTGQRLWDVSKFVFSSSTCRFFFFFNQSHYEKSSECSSAFNSTKLHLEAGFEKQCRNEETHFPGKAAQLCAFEQPFQSNSITEKLLCGHFASMAEFRVAHKLKSTIMRAYEQLHQLPICTD